MKNLIEQLAALVVLQQAATAGPWFNRPGWCPQDITVRDTRPARGDDELRIAVQPDSFQAAENWPANAAFIAGAGSFDFAGLLEQLQATPALADAELANAHSRELGDVFKERARQLRKFGPQNRTPQQWFLILSEEVGEVAKECVELEFDDTNHPHANPDNYYKELTEVAAVALAAMQNYNQRRPVPTDRIAVLEARLQEIRAKQDGKEATNG
ncbi:MAG: hypothetical protein ACRYFX_29220 [Janthinobacterium lividum]